MTTVRNISNRVRIELSQSNITNKLVQDSLEGQEWLHYFNVFQISLKIKLYCNFDKVKYILDV